MKTEDGRELAVVANQIVQSRHRLAPREQKVLIWAIGKIARADQELFTHRLSVAEFARLTGSHSGSIYKEMEEVTKNLLGSIVEIRNEGERERRAFQWVSECLYREGEGTVEIRLHDALRPYLLELRSRFTQVRLERIWKLRSRYSIRFLEYLEMQRGKGVDRWQMTMEELREWLGLDPKAYSDGTGAFEKSILQVAQRELDSLCDCSFDYEKVKAGRKIAGYNFRSRTAKPPSEKAKKKAGWNEVPVEKRGKVLAAARERPRWSDMTDDDILLDTAFLKMIPDLLKEVEAVPPPA